MASTYLVTGAAGFIGSHVSEALLARGDTVIGLDNLNDYYSPERKRANVAEVAAAAEADRFRFVEGDIRDEEVVAELLAPGEIEAIVHLAAMAGVRNSIDHPVLYYDVNLSGTLTLLEQVVKLEESARPRFAFASTSSVYGETKRIPFVEDDVCDRPLAPYPASKRAAEMLGYTYHNVYGIDFACLRFFTVYGPRGRPDMMAYKVADSIYFDREIPLYNGGRMSRDWTYVGDIAAGVVAAADRARGYEVVNLGRGEPVGLGEFVGIIEELTGKKANVRSEPMPMGDIESTHADIGKASSLFGYQPTVSVREGIENFLNWYTGAVLEPQGIAPPSG